MSCTAPGWEPDKGLERCGAAGVAPEERSKSPAAVFPVRGGASQLDPGLIIALSPGWLVAHSGATLMTCSMVTEACGNRSRARQGGVAEDLSHTDDFIFAAFAFIPPLFALLLLLLFLCLLSGSVSLFDGAKNGTWYFLFFLYLAKGGAC